MFYAWVNTYYYFCVFVSLSLRLSSVVRPAHIQVALFVKHVRPLCITGYLTGFLMTLKNEESWYHGRHVS